MNNHTQFLLQRAVLFAVMLLGFSTNVFAQPISTKPEEGIRTKSNTYIAYTNLRIVVSSTKVIPNGMIVVRNGMIESVSESNTVPKGAMEVSLFGKWAYPSFVEPYGVQKGVSSRGSYRNAGSKEKSPSAGTRHWNDAIQPENKMLYDLPSTFDDKFAREWQEIGVGTVLLASNDKMMRGSGVIIAPNASATKEQILTEDFGQYIAFDKGSSSTPYPSSLMGGIALLRQTFYDADWYKKSLTIQKTTPSISIERNSSLQALSESIEKKTPFIFETQNELNLFRADKIAKEFSLPTVYVGSGLEYRRLQDVKALHPNLILPVNFPVVPDVTSLTTRSEISYGTLRYWYFAPFNPFLLDSIGVNFCFTSYSLKSKKEYLPNIRKAIAHGLSETVALDALTKRPATLLQIDTQVGTIENGKLANFFIASGNIFNDSSEIERSIVLGVETSFIKENLPDIRGHWTLKTENSLSIPEIKLEIGGKRESPTITAKSLGLTLPATIKHSQYGTTFTVNTDTLGFDGVTRYECNNFSRNTDGTASGIGETGDGNSFKWICTFDSVYIEKKSPKAPETKRIELALLSPEEPFGFEKVPTQKTVLFKNATVWTSDKDGILKNTDVLISNGKIASIGKNLSSTKSNSSETNSGGIDTVIDCTNFVLTPGIIDEHSHIAISQGVNEGTHSITTEVRIGDVLNPDDVNIYRQLAGGVTSSHLLHGSANSMGGQLQYIKLRWGANADGLRFADAPGTVKFALGENVKQSNWGDNNVTRYPQTRMGVEEIMRDGFTAALEYEAAMKGYDTASVASKTSKLPPRRDIQLDALLEIVKGIRKIHCHSYVQSEILMLMRLCEEYGFRVQTFTHILEGYKLASEMAKHGAGASTFADWWAYKFEVFDAIPENAGIMHEQGVVVSINSDDAEMARRLNHEAAKSVKYGDVTEIDALKFITINSAKQMLVDKKTGSIAVGKDADVVLWNGNPLSNYSKVLQTYVDGTLLFDLFYDQQLKNRDLAIRQFLEQKAMTSVKKGEPSSKKNTRVAPREYHCDDNEDEMKSEEGGQ
jgi:imidazolonepropionase-like amidohydrolase